MAYLIAVPAPGKARGRAIDEGSVDTGGLTRTMRSTAHPRRDYLGRRALGRSMLATRAVCARLRVCHSMVPQLRDPVDVRAESSGPRTPHGSVSVRRELSRRLGVTRLRYPIHQISRAAAHSRARNRMRMAAERGVHTATESSAERHRARSCCRTSGGATLQPENRWSREREREGV